MAWTDGVDRAVNFVVTSVIWNSLLGATGSLMQLKNHRHNGTTGEGSQAVGPLSTLDLTDAAAPAAPGAGLSRFFALTGGFPGFRSGAAGAARKLAETTVDALDLADHSSRHEIGGADALTGLSDHSARHEPGSGLDEITALNDHNARHEPGGADPMAVDAVAATGSLRTLGLGAQQATAGTTFADHNARHEPGGADPMAVDAVAGTGSLRTLGGGAQQAAAGTHTHAPPHIEAKIVTADASGNATFTWTSAFGSTPAVVSSPDSAQSDAGSNITSRSTTNAVAKSDQASGLQSAIAMEAT